jgi:hypothetical protein
MPSQDCQSALYVEADTWLTDYGALISAYQRGFGANNVVVIDYDDEMKREGNVIPSFLRVLGVAPSRGFKAASYFLNTTNARNPPQRWSQRMIRAWRKWTLRKAA